MRALPLLVTYDKKLSVVKAMSKELRLNEEKTQLAVELLAQNLPPLATQEWLPFLFGVSPKLIGAIAVRGERYYRRFVLPKRGGGHREIMAPRRFLKTIQRWLLRHVLEKASVSDAATGFRTGGSIFLNAGRHVQHRNLLVVDIADFFPSITVEQVREMFVDNFPFPDTVASQLTGICTLAKSLPQGAPTSPTISNIVFRPVDDQLKRLVAEWHWSYSRYADDLAFSGNTKIGTAQIGAIIAVIKESGFRINQTKTRLSGPGRRQIVAGLVVNSRAQPSRLARRRWRAMFHRANKYPREFKDRTDQLDGIASFVHQYDEDLAADYRSVVGRIRDLET